MECTMGFCAYSYYISYHMLYIYKGRKNIGNTLLHTCSQYRYISRYMYIRVVFLVLRLDKALCNIQSNQIPYIFYLSFHAFAFIGSISVAS